MDKIYHGCMKKNADGSNKLIGPGQKFFVPTADCFQKNPSDVKHCKVKTRSHTMLHGKTTIIYFKPQEWISQWILGTNLEDN